jgi:hypothetical protein
MGQPGQRVLIATENVWRVGFVQIVDFMVTPNTLRAGGVPVLR